VVVGRGGGSGWGHAHQEEEDYRHHSLIQPSEHRLKGNKLEVKRRREDGS